ncbi:MAG: glycerate kinase [Bacteroides sp.]|nr:glycerate kinase [Prevotella sp.]MCM1407181.1 glycerate kinase [Treponema brennaborense]MCM1470333.1 glycerate kinase [Bacteroides sp.]
MKKFLLIPDSFKGTMSSKEICSIMTKVIQSYFSDAEIVSIPVADGGEGSVDAFLCACGGKKKTITVKGPLFYDIPSFYGIINDKKTAILEIAACAGLPLVSGTPNPEKTTTYGLGQLIIDAVHSGCNKIIIGLGGSATNDGGCGAAAALGVTFLDKNGTEFIPTGKTLSCIDHIDVSHILPEIKQTEIITICDIDNPLYGKKGAAYLFAAQKGADLEMIKRLDNGLVHLAKIVKRDLNLDVAHTPGAGAAGGAGYGLTAFLNSKLQMGIETILDVTCFNDHISTTDIIFTGEGKIDKQTLHGKVVIGVAKRAKNLGVPVIAVVGDIDNNIEKAYDLGVSAIFSINRIAADYQMNRLRAKNDLALTMGNLMRFINRFCSFENAVHREASISDDLHLCAQTP